MSDEHSIHRLHEFLPHLAERQPDLLSLLPEAERPGDGIGLREWVWSLPQRRLLEICSDWVIESLRQLRESSPLTNHILRGCLCFGGEFNLSDSAALAIGEVPTVGDPRREEIRAALQRAVRLGVLIHLPNEERYCVPFPVRLSFEGSDFLGPLESDTIRMRMVQHFAELARELAGHPELSTPKYWRFSNMLIAYEAAVNLAEDYLGLETTDWGTEPHVEHSIPENLAGPLMDFGRFLGRALVLLQTAHGVRLLGASAAAAHEHGSSDLEADLWALLGQWHLRQRDFGSAVRCYRTAERLRISMNDYRGAVLHRGAVAIALREMGDLELAVREFIEANQLARREHLSEEEVDTANCAARLLLELDRRFEVVQLVHDVDESLGEEADILASHAELRVNLAVALRHMDRPAECETVLRDAIRRARYFGSRPIEARAHLELARLSAQERCPDQALELVRVARGLYTEFGDHAGIAQCRIESARVRRSAGKYQAALESLQKAVRPARQSGDPLLLAEVYREKGLLAESQGEIPAAICHYNEETSVLRKTRQTALLVSAHLRLAGAYLSQEALLAAGTETLRAQALTRAYLRGEQTPALAAMVARIYALLTPAQIEYLVEEVTEELEGRKLRRS